MKIENKVVNNIRVMASEVVANAKSGHTGIVLSATPILYTLFAKHLKNSPKDPTSILRDRFVLSAGHGSALLYTILHCFGYNITLEDLKNFRKLDSVTSGHPELNTKLGIECTTGPLGQGVATAVGMALGCKMLQKYNKPDCVLFDNKIYTLIGDGCLMEGVSYEALSLAGTLALDNLIVLYDSNKTTLDSAIDSTYSVDVKSYVKSLGFEYFLVKNGNDISAIDVAIKKAKKCNKPAFVEIKTILGYGSNVQGKNSAHGLVMDDMQIQELKLNLGINTKALCLEPKTKDYLDNVIKNNKYAEEFDSRIKFYKEKYFNDFNVLCSEMNGKFSELKFNDLCFEKDKESTRNLGNLVLNKLAEKNRGIVGGNADLSSCTKAYINNAGNVDKSKFDAKNIFYGVREFAMSCMANGLALMGMKTFAGTFMVFSDYMRSAIRSSAIMNLPVTYILSHDSIAVGEDGPTHQPVEHLDSYRLMPNVNVVRPYNLQETIFAYNLAFGSEKTPTIISLTRQPIKLVETPQEELKNIAKGAYIISKESAKLKYIIVATGSEVALALEVKELLGVSGKSIRVVSMPCMEMFEKQTRKYKESIIPKEITKKIALEASSGVCISKYVGTDGCVIKVSDFGKSASMKDVFDYFGFTSEKVFSVLKK